MTLMTANSFKCERGGAIVECFVLSVVMIPLFLMIPVLGNLIDLKQSVVQASRYSAWEQTASTDMAPPSELRARFFEHPDVLLLTGQGMTGEINNLWNEEASDSVAKSVTGAGLNDTVVGISYEHGAGVSFTNNLAAGQTAVAIGHSTHAAATALSHLSDTEWNFEKSGFLDAGVQLNVENNWLLEYGGNDCSGHLTDRSFGCLSAHTAIVVDGWDSASLDQASRRSRSFVPGTLLRGLGNSISRLGYLPVTRELKGLKNAFGFVDPTILPLDRYAEQLP